MAMSESHRSDDRSIDSLRRTRWAVLAGLVILLIVTQFINAEDRGVWRYSVGCAMVSCLVLTTMQLRYYRDVAGMPAPARTRQQRQFIRALGAMSVWLVGSIVIGIALHLASSIAVPITIVSWCLGLVWAYRPRR